MKITPQLFEAFLHCPTKCWLTSTGEHGDGNAYAEWVTRQCEDYRAAGIEWLRLRASCSEYVTSPPAKSLKEAKWRLAFNVRVESERLESRIHAVERVPSTGRGKPAQFIPVRFIFRNKLTKEVKLLLVFDALVVSEVLGREVVFGRIIHGDEHATLKLKTGVLAGVRKTEDSIAAFLSTSSAPDLVLNRHCPECEFRDHCRQKAIEKDDLSLLAGLSAKERKEYSQKGIFSATQLSYTFRPRRRPKHLRDKHEKYHHALKALAIREKKIYVVGSVAFKVEGTPVYLDVEALPDRDFYYLIGARVKTDEGFVQHSLWADDITDEPTIWRNFLDLLAKVSNPCLIHYGSFEKTFLKQMSERHGKPPADMAGVVRAIENPINLVSAIFAQVYFPVFSNSLKDIARFLGFRWSESNPSGLLSITWRESWNCLPAAELKKRLIRYNSEDCEALGAVERAITRIGTPQNQKEATGSQAPEAIRTDDLRHPLVNKWNKFKSPLPDLEVVTNAAHWDYQRERIYVRTSKRTRRKAHRTPTHDQVWRIDKVVTEESSRHCPRCNTMGIKRGARRSKKVQEMLFGRFSLKRRVVLHRLQPYWCPNCQAMFGADPELILPGKRTRHSRSLLAYMFYQVIELYIPMQVVAKSLNRLFGLNMSTCNCSVFKARLAEYYAATQRQILERIIGGPLVHADETHFSVLGKPAYVWVFTNMHEVAYVYSETREGGLAQATLDSFTGVLVSDFYAVYDSLPCPQQKCLIHLIRDLNGAILDNPYDQELKQMVKAFGELVRRIVQEIERRGLKKHFLGKYLHDVKRFYREFVRRDYQSPAALSCVERFEKNCDKLFTFLKYDGVPWNNNNAEHAMKAFARLRDAIEGMSNEKGLKEYLVLLSICQTCQYQRLDFLDFLRSGEKDIEVFAQQQRGSNSR